MTITRPRFSSLTLAAYGWCPADWLQAFYPDDLPEDWRNTYYANEFSTVLLAAGDWVQPDAQASHWREDLQADFSFYLEITPALLRADHWKAVQAAIETHLSGQVKGLLLPEACVSALPASWQFPLHLLSLERLLAEMPAGAEAQTGILRAETRLSPQELRNTFEHLQQNTAHKDVVLFLDTPWVTLEQIRLMQQLYGV